MLHQWAAPPRQSTWFKMTIDTAIYLQSIALIILAIAVAILNYSVRRLIAMLAMAMGHDEPEPPDDHDEKSIS